MYGFNTMQYNIVKVKKGKESAYYYLGFLDNKCSFFFKLGLFATYIWKIMQVLDIFPTELYAILFNYFLLISEISNFKNNQN